MASVTLLPPRNFAAGDWSGHYTYLPHGAVSGDYVDVLAGSSPETDAVVMVGDVSGKGVGAGMIAAGIHASVRLLSETEPSLAGVASRINSYLVGATEDNRFATFAMVWLAADGNLTAVNAGHCPVLIRRRDGTVEQIKSGGLPLGILERATYLETTTRLEPGDLMLLFTDLHYRSCAIRTGHLPWPGPSGRLQVVARSIPAMMSPSWAAHTIRRVERDFLGALVGMTREISRPGEELKPSVTV